MHQCRWLSERGGNFLNLLQKDGDTQKGGGGGVPTLEEIMKMYVSKYKSNGISPELNLAVL